MVSMVAQAFAEMPEFALAPVFALGLQSALVLTLVSAPVPKSARGPTGGKDLSGREPRLSRRLL
ncbi:hypothetical protein [Paraburkholderia elongata]|uniref:Uncharacterized protein n=1 Tax=Paraburkholderia elongata TaxID=2675747 RepID=A0A972SKL5_9BURK|nr:hypothetical protein [Paraburkholderia elongata]NPT58182.1 hypothetical protein [Paraburkholderia elongata]NPT62130.1 hypothetical protein [Paraburkholderia elongata]